MTPELEDAWRAGKTPFNGVTISPTDAVPLAQLTMLMPALLRELRLAFGDAKLLTFECWHEHDGYLHNPKSSTLEVWERHCATENALYSYRSGEFAVFRSVYDSERRFLLRVNPWDEDDDKEEYPGKWGEVDVTVPCLLYTSPSPRDATLSRMPSSA